MKSGLAQAGGRSLWIVGSQGQVSGVTSSRVGDGGGPGSAAISAREILDQERKKSVYNAEARIVTRKDGSIIKRGLTVLWYPSPAHVSPR